MLKNNSKTSVPCLFIPLLLLIIVYTAESLILNINNVKEINGINKDSYFGYSLLLQKGKNPAVVVGAPKKSNDKSDGLVYRCFLDGKCLQYNINMTSSPYAANGNFLGSTLDGDDFEMGKMFVSMPNHITTVESKIPYMMGALFHKDNSSSVYGPQDYLEPLKHKPRIGNFYGKTSYYSYGYAESSFDLHYIKDNILLIGAPGVKTWSGAFLVQSTNTYRQTPVVIPKGTGLLKFEDLHGYLGYTVTSGRFEPSRQLIWYISGAPKTNQVRGSVQVFKGTTLILQIKGNEIGSYFGASILAVDLNNDGIDEMLIGAPMTGGSTWDEGLVHCYEISRKYEGGLWERKLLSFSSFMVGSRFGTSMVSLGDIDLDSYNDVAISAPYENDGVGVVYIYMGSKYGIKTQYSQRLSPLDFPNSAGQRSILGFGLGLSRGVDIDNNGHNDLAIGAYKSDKVFIITSYNIIDFLVYLEPNVTSVTSEFMNVRYCLSYTKRSALAKVPSAQFKIYLMMDYRASVYNDKNLTETWTVLLGQKTCRSINVIVQTSSTDIEPFRIVFKTELEKTSKTFAQGVNSKEVLIPYAHGCGEDDVCQTKILLDAIPTVPYVIIGYDKELVVNVTAENNGESAYNCQLYAYGLSAVVKIKHPQNCDNINDTTICYFASKLLGDGASMMAQYKFDIRSLPPTTTDIDLAFEVRCLGVDQEEDPFSNFTLRVYNENSPFVFDSKSEPNIFYINDESSSSVKIEHEFTFGNNGPSPVKMDVNFLLPIATNSEVIVYNITEVKGLFNNAEFYCKITDIYNSSIDEYNVENLFEKLDLNRTIVVDSSSHQYMNVLCEGGFLSRNSLATYTATITVGFKDLKKYYESELKTKNNLAYITKAFLASNTSVSSHVGTLFLITSQTTVPLWIYIIGIFAGLLLLALLILTLHKCHFFERNYRKKMLAKDVKLIDENKDDDNTDSISHTETASMNDVQLR